jgi:AraC-like DNA-binding protein
MPTLDVLLLDGASPSAYGITADIVDGANRLSLAQNPSRGTGPIAVRVLAVGRDGARLRAGIRLSATDIAAARPGPWVVVPGLGAASPTELSDLARAAPLSPRTLARRVRQATGLSPMELVQRIRLDVALQLLQHSDATIADIANRVGFSDAASLHRLVKQATGQAPGALRLAPSATM